MYPGVLVKGSLQLDLSGVRVKERAIGKALGLGSKYNWAGLWPARPQVVGKTEKHIGGGGEIFLQTMFHTLSRAKLKVGNSKINIHKLIYNKL